jgi:hypothetical protein
MKKASRNDQAELSTAPLASSIVVGIDWADKEHAFNLRTPDGKIHSGSFKHSPTDIQQWVEAWHKGYPDLTIDVCIEAKRGALSDARSSKTESYWPIAWETSGSSISLQFLS